MKFCPDCENYLKLDISEKRNNEQVLNYKCHNCNYIELYNSKESTCVYKNEYDSIIEMRDKFNQFYAVTDDKYNKNEFEKK